MFQFTPDILSAYQVSRYLHNQDTHALKNQNKKLYGFDMPLAVGMTASATFPYAVVGTTLWSNGCDENCYLQLFDGGLVDNLGLMTAIDLLRQDKAKDKLLIVVDAYHDDRQPFSKSRTPPRKLTLLKRVLKASADAVQRNMKTYAPTMVKDILCAHGAEHVMIAYLDLSKYPKAEQVGTSMWISKSDQDSLIKIGKELVKKNKTLSKDLPDLLSGMDVASCKQ